MVINNKLLSTTLSCLLIKYQYRVFVSSSDLSLRTTVCLTRKCAKLAKEFTVEENTKTRKSCLLQELKLPRHFYLSLRSQFSLSKA